MKRPLGAALLLFLIGTVYAVYGVTLSLIAGIILLLIFSGFTIKSRIGSWRKMIDIFMLFLFFSIGIIRGNIYTSEVAHRTSAYADGHKVTLTCIVDNIENKGYVCIMV
jgi:multisubunit Na+/H+ antiporter MnhE subunit